MDTPTVEWLVRLDDTDSADRVARHLDNNTDNFFLPIDVTSRRIKIDQYVAVVSSVASGTRQPGLWLIAQVAWTPIRNSYRRAVQIRQDPSLRRPTLRVDVVTQPARPASLHGLGGPPAATKPRAGSPIRIDPDLGASLYARGHNQPLPEPAVADTSTTWKVVEFHRPGSVAANAGYGIRGATRSFQRLWWTDTTLIRQWGKNPDKPGKIAINTLRPDRHGRVSTHLHRTLTQAIYAAACSSPRPVIVTTATIDGPPPPDGAQPSANWADDLTAAWTRRPQPPGLPVPAANPAAAATQTHRWTDPLATAPDAIVQSWLAASASGNAVRAHQWQFTDYDDTLTCTVTPETAAAWTAAGIDLPGEPAPAPTRDPRPVFSIPPDASASDVRDIVITTLADRRRTNCGPESRNVLDDAVLLTGLSKAHLRRLIGNEVPAHHRPGTEPFHITPDLAARYINQPSLHALYEELADENYPNLPSWSWFRRRWEREVPAPLRGAFRTGKPPKF